MVNLSIVVNGTGSFYLGNYHVKDAFLNVKFFVDSFLRRIAKYDTKRVASLTTDTCAVMRGTWSALEKHPKLTHALFIPCDSHGLRLLIKDFLE